MNDLRCSGVRIAGLAATVPKNRQDNQHHDALDAKGKNEIIEKVGIRYRHIAPDGMTAADLCQNAATKLLDELKWKSEGIGLLVFITQTPDHLIPGSATQLQQHLGLPENVLALDINQGCAGYVYGLSVISGLMSTYKISKALLLVGDTISRIISENDNSLWPIFADAGSATALELDPSASEMMFKVGSKGSQYKAIHVPDGGARTPISEESLGQIDVSPGVSRQSNQLLMNGQAVFTFGLSTVAGSILELLKESEVLLNDVDYLVLHQANQLLNDSIVRKVGFSKEKAPSSLRDFGNTSCATIPVTLVSQLRNELVSGQQKLLLSGFGVGLSWGNVLLSTDSIACPKMLFI